MNTIGLRADQCIVKHRGQAKVLELTREWKQDGDTFFARHGTGALALTPNLPKVTQQAIADTVKTVVKEERALDCRSVNQLPADRWVISMPEPDSSQTLELFHTGKNQLLSAGPKGTIIMDQGRKAQFFTPDGAHYSATKAGVDHSTLRAAPKFYRVTKQEAQTLMAAVGEAREGSYHPLSLRQVGLAGRIGLQLSGAFSHLLGKNL